MSFEVNGSLYTEKLDRLQLAIDYLEAHLDADVSIEDLAGVAGYTRDHFATLFSKYLGMSVSSFRTKRRLMHIVYAYGMGAGGTRGASGHGVTEIALRYGFETHGGFYKAFTREYGCSVRYYMRYFGGGVTPPKPFDLLREGKLTMTTTQIKKLLKHWETGDLDFSALAVRQAEQVGGQVICNHVWHIGEDYILKTMQNVVQLRNHLKIGEELDRVGFKAQTALLTKAGEKTLVYEGRTYALMHRVQGDFMRPEDHVLEDLGKVGEIGFKYGAALGEMHRALERAGVKGGVSGNLSGNVMVDDLADELLLKEVNIIDVLKGWAIEGAKRHLLQWQCPLPESFYHELLEALESLVPKLPRQVIHRDPNPSNIIWEKGDIVGFIDFAISEINIRVFDLCYCATGILSEAWHLPQVRDTWPTLFSGMVEGYHSACENGLSSEEMQVLPKIAASIFIIFLAWLNDHDSYAACGPNNREMLNWFVNGEIFKNSYFATIMLG